MSTSTASSFKNSTTTAAIVVEYLQQFQSYYILTLVCVGLIGNSISFVIFGLTKLRSKSVHILFAVLASIDNGFLLVLLVIELKHFNLDLIDTNLYGCKLAVYLPYLFGFLSTWLVVLFSIERFTVVYFPFKNFYRVDRKCKIGCICFLSLFGAVFYSYGIWTTQLEAGGHCMTSSEWIGLLRMMTFLDMLLTMFLPFILILVLNLLIIFKLRNDKKDLNSLGSFRINRASNTKSSPSSSNLNLIFKNNINNTCNNRRQSQSIELIPINTFIMANKSSSDSSGGGGCGESQQNRFDSHKNSLRLKKTQQPRKRSWTEMLSNGSNSRRDSGANMSTFRLRFARLLTKKNEKQSRMSRQEQQSKTTRMLLILSTTFLLLHGPTALLKLWYLIQHHYYDVSNVENNNSNNNNNNNTNKLSTKSTTTLASSSVTLLSNNGDHHQHAYNYDETHPIEEILERVTCYIYYLHYSLNFFLYVFNIRKFREFLLKRLLKYYN